LQKIFPSKNSEIIIQRFGDPDQAIYNRINHEDPNESYNNKPNSEFDFIINKSHRFDDSIAQKIKNLSYNEIQVTSDLSESDLLKRREFKVHKDSFEHTIFVYGDNNIDQVITKYAESIHDQFSENYKRSKGFVVKVLGAVGNDINNEEKDLKIGSYWNKFVKKKNHIFDGSSLIEVIKSSHNSSDVDIHLSYKALNDYILRVLIKANFRDLDGKFFNKTSFKNFLTEKGLLKRYQKFLVSYLIDKRGNQIDEAKWKIVENFFAKIFDPAPIPNELKFILLNDSEQNVDKKLVHKKGNVLRYDDCFDIELSTIHGAKGETHDSTLILETKNQLLDLSTMLPYLTHELPSITTPNLDLDEKPHHKSKKPNQQFMRQLFVAMSRPKHLLCLAVHEKNISDEIELVLKNNLGWKIQKI
jgi:hypothetical protein